MTVSAQVNEIIERPPPQVRPWTGARILGVGLLVFWAVLAVLLVAYLANRWNPDLFARYAPAYMSGLWLTVKLTVISILIGAVLSVPIAWARMSTNRVANALSYGYVYFFRGTPLLAQTFLVYYGLGEIFAENRQALAEIGLWNYLRDSWWYAVVAFSLNTAAYQAEILRGAIQAVPKGQWEGAASLALTPWQAMRKIVAPQALIVALRPYGNEIILMIKGSAVVSIIAVQDLMFQTKLAYSRSFDFQTYIWAALIYLAIVEVLRHLIDWMERRITRHLVR